MYQLVDFATRANNILDVLLTDDEQIITDIAADSPIGHSDHLMVTFKAPFIAQQRNSTQLDVELS